MIETLTVPLILLFYAVLLVLFFWRFIRDKDYENFSAAGIAANARTYFLFLVPLVLLFGLAGILGISFGAVSQFGWMLVGFVVPALVSSSGISIQARSLIILALSVLSSLFFGGETLVLNFSSYLVGLLSWKTVDYLLIQGESTLEDALPSLLWLAGIFWTQTVDTGNWLALHQKMILGTMTVVLFMKLMQGPYLTNDKLYLKRIGLASFGLLCLLIYVNQLMSAWELGKLTVIAGVGFFLAYLFDAMDLQDNEEKITVLHDIKKVLFIGIFTLLISRLFGMFGLVILGAAMLVSTTSGIALLAAAFWIARVLVQTFIFDFNSNITGINIMHSYTGAALFAGFFLVVALSLLIKKLESRLITSILFATALVMAPVTAVYFLHAEPAASLLYSSLVASVLVGLMAPSIYGEEASFRQGALLLIPSQLTSFAILANQLIEKGNNAGTQERMIALVVACVLASLVLLLIQFLTKKQLKNASAEN